MSSFQWKSLGEERSVTQRGQVLRGLYMPQQLFEWKKLSRAIRLSVYVRCNECELSSVTHTLCGGEFSLFLVLL